MGIRTSTGPGMAKSWWRDLLALFVSRPRQRARGLIHLSKYAQY